MRTMLAAVLAVASVTIHAQAPIYQRGETCGYRITPLRLWLGSSPSQEIGSESTTPASTSTIPTWQGSPMHLPATSSRGTPTLFQLGTWLF
jgi:hypothetical protein